MNTPCTTRYADDVTLEYITTLEQQVTAQQARIAELREALEELIACKNLADKFDALKENVHDFATATVVDGIHAEYLRRKPAAWQAAKEAVTPPDDLSALEEAKRQARREALLEAAAWFKLQDWEYSPDEVAEALTRMAGEVNS